MCRLTRYGNCVQLPSRTGCFWTRSPPEVPLVGYRRLAYHRLDVIVALSVSRRLRMAKLTLSEAARACNVARTTIQRAVKTGRISLDAEHRIDTAELLRVGYQLDAAVLHAATQQSTMQTQQNAAPQHSTPQQQGAATHELQLLRHERDALQRERDLLMQQVSMLHTMHQTTQQQLTQAQQMLHEMQHRYDRLLEAPRRVLSQS